jgi:hypothetical protein
MKRGLVDTGFMGSIIGSWIKLAHVVKFFTSSHTSSKGRNIVAKSASINTTEEEVVLNIFSRKLIQPLLKKVKNHGTQV